MRINETGPYLFLLDTGSSVLAVSRALLKDARLIAPELDAALKVSDTVTDFQGDRIRVGHVEIGGAHFREIEALALNLSPVSQEMGSRVDGILGFSLFRHCLLTLDYPARQMRLHSLKGHIPRAGEKLPLSLTEQGPRLPILIGEAKHEALLDSGSSHLLVVPEKTAEKIPLTAKPAVLGEMRTLARRYPAKYARLDCDVRVGPHLLERPIVNVWPGVLILGSQFLSHYSLTFDQEAGHVWMTRASTEPVTSRSLRSIGVLFRNIEGRLTVAKILPGFPVSPLPVRRGDLILAIQGHPTDQLNYDRWHRLLEESDAIELRVHRRGRTFEATLRVVTVVE